MAGSPLDISFCILKTRMVAMDAKYMPNNRT